MGKDKFFYILENIMHFGLKKKLFTAAVALGFALAMPVAGMAGDTIKRLF